MSSDAWAEYRTSRASCAARRVEPAEYESLKQEGDYYVKGGRITIWLPGHSRHMGSISLPIDGSGAWRYNGNLDKPTLEPSIRVSTKRPLNPEDPPEKWQEVELWHGFLTDGQLKSC